MTIVGLSSTSRSKGVSVARYLVEYHDFARYSMEEPIRQMLLAVDPVMPAGGERLRNLVADFGWDKLRNHYVIGPELRRMMTDVESSLTSQVATDATCQAFDAWYDRRFGRGTVPHRVIVTDIKTAEEADRIIRRHGTVVRLSADDSQPPPFYVDHNIVASDDARRDVARILGLEPRTTKEESTS